jgi:hypothetical protein
MKNVLFLLLFVLAGCFNLQAGELKLSKEPITPANFDAISSDYDFTDQDYIYAMYVFDGDVTQDYKYAHVKFGSKDKTLSYIRTKYVDGKTYHWIDILPEPAKATSGSIKTIAEVLEMVPSGKPKKVTIYIDERGKKLLSQQFTFQNTGSTDLMDNAKKADEYYNTFYYAEQERNQLAENELPEKYTGNDGAFSDPDMSRSFLKELITTTHNYAKGGKVMLLTIESNTGRWDSDWHLYNNKSTGLPQYKESYNILTVYQAADGKCYYEHLNVRMDYLGGGSYGDKYLDSLAGAQPISCDRVPKAH